jgi:anti-sigma regulatory factor (Ser/Thr protein kinase)
MSFEHPEASQENHEAYEKSFSWDNDRAHIEEAQTLVEAELLKLGWPEDQAYGFSLAVNEAVSNAIVHGNLKVNKKDDPDTYFERLEQARALEENKAKHVEVAFQFTSDEAMAEIKDEGDFVPNFTKDREMESNPLQGSGEGLNLIGIKVDDIEFSPGTVILRKYRKDNEDGI